MKAGYAERQDFYSSKDLKMLTQMIFLVLVLPLPVRCQTYTWAYSTYLDVEFSFSCNDTRIILTDGDEVVWKTPQQRELRPGHNDSDYLVVDLHDIPGHDLMIKNVSHDLHGTYVCMVYNNGTLRKKAIRGLNLYEPLHRNLMERFTKNIIVGVISSLVFSVPVVTLCMVLKFRYMTNEEKERIKMKKSKVREMASLGYVDPSEKVKVKDFEGKGCYDNPVVTPL
ncbi:hypothetical protein CHS0354_041989 [Potamilus streckersoni]|uniref:Ig-like domain-containing protein n=1 Tax=Potamilus streckersoni TaxID=2493646 RepID=A0AAE0TAU8_9BIVA|nr:hypothetical protein CHS0354_041989 [Potamilus streckersoni]